MIVVYRALRTARTTLVALAIPLGLVGQVDPTSPPLDASIEARVRALVAEAWAVSEERVALDPGSIRDGWTPPERPVVELLGSGSGGHWVVRVAAGEPAEKPAAAEAESFRIRAGVLTTAPVAARGLKRGQAVAASDVVEETRVVWGPPRDDDGEAVQVGWVTARIIDKGDELRRPAVRPPLAVRSGSPVQLVWRRGGVALRVAGRAAGSAAMGEDVLVRTESGERLQGRVVAPGVVDVTGPGSEP